MITAISTTNDMPHSQMQNYLTAYSSMRNIWGMLQNQWKHNGRKQGHAHEDNTTPPMGKNIHWLISPTMHQSGVTNIQTNQINYWQTET